MAIIYPVSRRYQVTVADDGHFLVLGNVSNEDGGFWRIHWVPDPTFVGGGLAVMGRASGKDAYDDGVNFGTVAYRRVQLGGAASDYTLVQTSGVAVPLVGDAIIQVPADGLSIAIGVDCQSGSGYIYSQALRFPSV